MIVPVRTSLVFEPTVSKLNAKLETVGAVESFEPLGLPLAEPVYSGLLAISIVFQLE